MSRIIRPRNSTVSGVTITPADANGAFVVVSGAVPSHIRPDEMECFDSDVECDAAHPEISAARANTALRAEHKARWAKHDISAVYAIKVEQATLYLSGATSGYDLIDSEAQLRGITVQALADMILAIAAPPPTLEAEELARISEKLALV